MRKRLREGFDVIYTMIPVIISAAAEGAAGRGRCPYAHVPALSAGSASGSPKKPQKSPASEQIPIKFQTNCLSPSIQEFPARAERLKELSRGCVNV
ncbi:hypothetical protein EK904_001779 [Melospiza melodia maxima]|nr:hypothetical protein EK904_001779 [Melospiza melodia maxima]